MPLKNYSKKTTSENIKREMERGRPQRQAVAISLESARRAKKKAGKPAGGLARKKK